MEKQTVAEPNKEKKNTVDAVARRSKDQNVMQSIRLFVAWKIVGNVFNTLKAKIQSLLSVNHQLFELTLVLKLKRSAISHLTECFDTWIVLCRSQKDNQSPVDIKRWDRM